MTNPVIKVENLSKHYRLGVIGGGTLREDISRWWAKKRGKPDPYSTIDENDVPLPRSGQVWALRDVNLEVNEGEILGIIGRNGAGKSTLLKILSRITAPTSGRAVIKGRIGSLLEVGTGFHPELTGRENIYLNGAILGMRHAEVTRKLDEIISFAENTKFIDTPVKRYSSGMLVRLAFAVAAHLDPEILIVDEVLAVGDAAFQRKCLGKMKNVSEHGRTVLFVSHNMGMITSLCKTGALLDKGGVLYHGTASEAVNSYFNQNGKDSFSATFRNVGDNLAKLLEAHVENHEGRRTGEIDIRKPMTIKMTYEVNKSVPVAPYPNFHFFDMKGEYAFVASSRQYRQCKGTEAGRYTAECVVPGYLLNSATYFIGLALTFTHQGLHVSFFEKDALSVTVVDPIEETLDDMRCGYSGSIPGMVRPKLEWHIVKH